MRHVRCIDARGNGEVVTTIIQFVSGLESIEGSDLIAS